MFKIKCKHIVAVEMRSTATSDGKLYLFYSNTFRATAVKRPKRYFIFFSIRQKRNGNVHVFHYEYFVITIHKRVRDCGSKTNLSGFDESIMKSLRKTYFTRVRFRRLFNLRQFKLSTLQSGFPGVCTPNHRKLFLFTVVFGIPHDVLIKTYNISGKWGRGSELGGQVD